MSHRIGIAFATLVTLLGSVGLASPAAAQREPAAGAVPAEVLVVLASEDAGEVDAALADMEALRRPPFNAYRSMRILSRPRHMLEMGTPVDVDLPNGRRLRLALQRILPDGRFRVRVSINRPDNEDYLPLLTVVAAPGDPFFVAGQGFEGGTLVIGVRLGGAPAARDASKQRNRKLARAAAVAACDATC